ncbi:MAG TPA: CHASE4 domain-containing protein [Methanolinea sp.]|nr:CHASE4 domain-containing protein [Methanolinea sp.]
MKIRSSVTLTFIIVIVISLLIVAVATQLALYPAVKDIEKREAENAVLKVIRIIEYDLGTLGGTCEDWGKWDDTYYFAKGENEGYPAENLVNETFLALRLDLMLFYDTNGTLVYGKGFDYSRQVALSIPDDLSHIPAIPEPDSNNSGDDVPPLSGVISTSRGPLLASIGPILPNDRTGPAAGYLLIGRYLDGDETTHYASLAMANLTFREAGPADEPGFAMSPGFHEAIPITLRLPATGEYLVAESTINDISGSPAFITSVTIERTVFQIGRNSFILFFVIVVLAGGAIGITAVRFLDRKVLSRVSLLEKTVREITEQKDFKGRTALSGDDEISSLSTSIDRMLDALDEHVAAETAAKDDARLANAKLTLLSRITRHDVLNQVTIVRGFADLLAESIPQDSADIEYLRRIRSAAKTIEHQLAFMREYELEASPSSVGWIDVRKLFLEVAMGMGLFGVKAEVLFDNLFIYSDRLLAKIFSTLIDNSVSHGERVDRITLSFYESGDKGVLVYEDNGIGIPPDQKELIFEQGVGRNLGIGLFLARGILSVYGMEIRETGEYGKGARFEILVPRNKYRKTEGGNPPPSP